MIRPLLIALATSVLLGGCGDSYKAGGTRADDEGAELIKQAQALAKPHRFTPTPCRVDRLVQQPATAAGLPRLTVPELAAAQACVEPYQRQVYAATNLPLATAWTGWMKVSSQAYRSEHGVYLMAYANPAAKGYTDYDKVQPLPVGARLAKASFGVSPDGQVSVGPVFFMEKMPNGFWPKWDDWRYTLIQGDGRLMGMSLGDGANEVQYCALCHGSAKKTDYLLLVPEPYRVKG